MIPHRDRDFRSSPEIGHVRSETPVTLLRNDRSRSIGIVGHVAPETSVTLVRNTQRNSAGFIGTVSDISAYREEIEKLIAGTAPPTVVATDSAVGDPGAFAMEKHLEDFLVLNWAQTDFGKDYDLFVEDGEVVGQQYQTDTGPIDLLAIRKD